MAQNKQTPCKDCSKPAFGPRCRTCSNKVNPRNTRKPTFQQRVFVTMPKAKELAPTCSWWMETADFYGEAHKQFSERIAKGTGATYTPSQAESTHCPNAGHRLCG